MLKYYCDMCGKHINMNVDGVTLLFNAQGMSMRNTVNEDKHLCIDAAVRLKALSLSQQKLNKKDDGALMSSTVKRTLYMHFSNTNSIS